MSIITFIIPAMNEEKHIENAIDSIIKTNDNLSEYDIIVVDNGSIDKTRSIAKNKGANVIVKPKINIGSLRNQGVLASTGEILVFIDADVYLDLNWGIQFQSIIEMIKYDPMVITGSTYAVSRDASWVSRYWYEPIIPRLGNNYINGGHLIVSKKLFEILGGFREDLETGEDYDFCQRANKLGARIVNRPDLVAVHHGYPESPLDFFHRERWHGRGDYTSFRSTLSSKPALCSVTLALILLLSFCLVLYYREMRYFYLYFFANGILSISSAVLRCGGMNSYFPACAVLYVVYFLARGLALFDVLYLKLFKTRLTSKGQYC